jgi:hypothetical protein
MITPSTPSLESSLTLIDFKDFQTFQHGSSEYSLDDLQYPYTEQKDIFQTLFQQAEIQDEITSSCDRSANTRRPSMHNLSCRDKENFSAVKKRHRRHSTFDPRNRQGHRDAHDDFESYLLSQNNRQQSNIVNTLMDFHSSIDKSLEASFWKDMKPSLCISYPILSYLDDTDDDSIEMSKMKRSSLVSDPRQNEDFEYLNDDSDSDSDVSYEAAFDCKDQEYITRLNEEDVQYFQSEKRRQVASYKVLERRLSTESHVAILKSLIGSKTDDSS